jgi:hypothetical protein
VLLVSSLVLILGLRLYAAFLTVPIKTWDDSFHRFCAVYTAGHSSLAQAAVGALLPNEETFVGRSIGYHSWLVFGRKLTPSSVSDERAWQAANVGMLLFTLAALMAAWRLFGVNWFWSLVGANLFLLSPIVFGINRWLMTEVHLIMALAFCFLALALAWRPSSGGGFPRRMLDEVTTGLAVGFLLALASTMREYAIPLYFGYLALVLGILAYRKRFAGIVVCALVVGPYMIALSKSLPVLRELAVRKAGMAAYSNPFTKYVWHTVIHAMGLGLSLLFIAGLVLVAMRIMMMFRAKVPFLTETSRVQLPVVPPMLVLLAGLCIYLAGGLTINTTARNAIPGYCGMVAGVIPVLASLLPGIARTRLVRFALVLVVLAWGFMYYDLFVAFRGGAAFAHHPTNIEYYNHPLHLRPLASPEDMHVVKY